MATDGPDNINLRLLRQATPGQLSSLTNEQRALLGKTREQLEQETSQFSFDIDAFSALFKQGEDWHHVIQAHLYLDHTITAITSEALVRPDAIRLSRMGFAQKLELVEAMALLPTDLIGSVAAINRLRNQIAHQLNFKISSASLLNFKNSIPKHIREAAQDNDGRDEKSDFIQLLKSLVYMVDIIRQRHAFSRLVAQQSSIGLALSLQMSDETLKKRASTATKMESPES